MNEQMTQQITQTIQAMMPIMIMGMTMGMVKPVMLQEEKLPHAPDVEKQRLRIREIREGHERYEVIPVTALDDEVCRGYGYTKGALSKYREIKTGMISTFCRLE